MRALSIVLGVLLVMSLMGNAGLGVTVLNANRQILELQESVNQKQTRINGLIEQYNEANGQIKAANEVVATQQNTINRLQAAEETYKRDLNNYRDRLAKADYFVSRAKCSVMVDELKAFAATRNEDIRPAVFTALQSLYSGKIMSSKFAPIWGDGSNSVMLTTQWDDGLTKTIIVWSNNDRAIQTIYDVNAGCVMYTGDR